MIRLTVGTKRLNRIDHRLFGQFLERASWGEPGPEAVADEVTGDLPADALSLMAEMSFPIVRFPGGTDIDYIDWRDLIDNAPGRSPERPVTVGHKGHEITNRYGLDEYFRLRDRLGVQTILVCNLLDAVGMTKPLREAALTAAGLLAYCNAPLGGALPDGMPDWPAVREANGHPEPYQVEYFQIGNEWNYFLPTASQRSGITDRNELAKWYCEVVNTYIDLIRKVDPNIKIIIDAHCTAAEPGGDDRDRIEGDIERIVLRDSGIRSRIDYAAIHEYAPGPMDGIATGNAHASHPRLTDEQWWYAWVAMPGAYSTEGKSLGLDERSAFARSLGIPVACTEWNWNGWGYNRLAGEIGIGYELAAGIGAAGFLQGLMRDGDTVEIACQSMLLGVSWGITAIRVDPSGEQPAHYRPTGNATAFYARHHGAYRLEAMATGVPVVSPPFGITRTPPRERVALLDSVVTADESRVFVHMINRAFGESFEVEIDLGELASDDPAARDAGNTTGHAVCHLLTGDLKPCAPGTSRQMTTETSVPVRLSGCCVRVSVPPHSISIVEVPVNPQGAPTRAHDFDA